MTQGRKPSYEERKKLNRMYREGLLSREELMEKMKNGLFDHERLKVKRKFVKLFKSNPSKRT
ncbi:MULTISPECIES: hypothetical protein [Thermoactinomyces]|jgi:hypothetical protein|uniref:Uncharacterized protein n=1 Tax=Thermoactinomyces vulgaris TaxID=2026 RepID=A0ABS0QDC9_THEVU|nr:MULTISPECIES: hypothetical protein [Thermoactinomyces]KYQ87936.1 hypothetical protein AYX07_04500 [Thermoactinomyces sp. AS95]MBA4550523.1 hypothetical protein [Thermoactinomyces vulgaris]MBA4595934.1 hypothetical protein [Thermoactinomyces vulgaris]MBH8582407.1 hypothetical protein [Thermoactinomyces sp. CICC 10735]MBH8584797.1 hypothetical protein [Thermoactinomyces sp. CICC 10520]